MPSGWSGQQMKAVNPPAEGEKVVVYIDEVGRFEGTVIRSSKHAFAVDYRARRGKAQRTADALTEAIHKRAMSLDRRGAPRIEGTPLRTIKPASASSLSARPSAWKTCSTRPKRGKPRIGTARNLHRSSARRASEKGVPGERFEHARGR